MAQIRLTLKRYSKDKDIAVRLGVIPIISNTLHTERIEYIPIIKNIVRAVTEKTEHIADQMIDRIVVLAIKENNIKFIQLLKYLSKNKYPSDQEENML